jgi:hypothetical protein
MHGKLRVIYQSVPPLYRQRLLKLGVRLAAQVQAALNHDRTERNQPSRINCAIPRA